MSAGTDQRMKGQSNQGMLGPSFGQQSSYNYFPNNGENFNKNAWDSQQVNGSRRGHDDYYRGNDKRSYGNDGVKSIEHGMQGMGLDGGKSNSASAAKESTDKPKKMTWATIASQPVKSSQARVSSTLKKKPGMPPPPMIPGKHNMDIGSWDTEKNGSSLVPPPVPSPPPVSDGPSPFQFQPPTKNNSNSSAGNQNAQQLNNSSAPNRNGDRYRDDRGPITRDRDSRGSTDLHPNDMRGGYRQNPNNRYQSHQRSNYGPNSDRPNYNDNNSKYQPRPQYRTSPPSSYNQSHHNGPTRHYESDDPETEQPKAPVYDVDDAKPEPIEPEPVAEKLLDKGNYNPSDMDMEKLDKARFFVIKSYSEDDIHRSIKYEIWCSTEHGNKRLDQAFRDAEAENGFIYLLFSVNGSGHFCGVAQMTSAVDYNSVSSVWHQDKWKGKFSLKWIYVKDVPNSQLRHIRLENNENKSVTNSRDTQEVPNAKGQQVLQIIHIYKHSTSIFDDIEFYEQRQVEEHTKKVDIPPHQNEDEDRHGLPSNQYRENRGFHRNESNYRDNYDNNRGVGRNSFGNYQGNNNRGYQNSYDNNRRDDYHQRPNFDRPPIRDYNSRREGGGFMSRDRGDNNRIDYRDRMERNDDHHPGGFKRNNSNNFGNRGSNNNGGPNMNSGYRN